MSINYDWKIDQMEVYSEKDGYKNVIFMIHWRCNANENDYNVTTYGSVGVELNEELEFTEYNDLTKEQIIEWVEKSLGEDQINQIKSGLDTQIYNLKIQPVVSVVLGNS